jgi:hypothetical protein
VRQAHTFQHVAGVADVELEVQQRAAAFGRGSIALSRRLAQAARQAPGAIAGQLGARLFDGQAVERPDRLVVVMARMGLDLELAEFAAVQDEPVDARSSAGISSTLRVMASVMWPSSVASGMSRCAAAR